MGSAISLRACGRFEVDRRLLDLDVADEASGEQGSPMDAGAQALDAQNRGLGMGVLRDHDVVEIEREAHGMKVERSDARGVALTSAPAALAWAQEICPASVTEKEWKNRGARRVFRVRVTYCVGVAADGSLIEISATWRAVVRSALPEASW